MIDSTSVLESKSLTVDEFLVQSQEFVRSHELIDGKATPTMFTGAYHGRILAHLILLIGGFVLAKKLGQIFADAMFRLSPMWAPAPDIAFVRQDLVSKEPIAGPFPGAPDVAIEIVSPGDTHEDTMAKIDGYLNFGVSLVWLVEPRLNRVTVFTKSASPIFKLGADIIDGGAILPGFKATAAEFFPAL